jgi:magnesium chelatase subunit I
MWNKNQIYPFSAIVGQEDMKNALILNLINPLIGGVLIRGEKGTAKSTAVRALVDLLPDREEVEGCIFSCDPADESAYCDNCARLASEENIEVIKGKMKVVNLPINATEDRVAGTLDIEHAIKKGEKRFEPGILAEANRNILYVDEVNLLNDHVVDLLLDAAAMGVNTVEREGISYSHPSKFVLIGTMNPEEGDVRPQLIDRFGLVVDISGVQDTEQRMEVIKRRLEFESDPDSLARKLEPEQQKLADRIEKAKVLIREVSVGNDALQIAAEIAVKLQVSGHRADITMIKTAMTNAAFYRRTEVNTEDIYLAARLSLPHRVRHKAYEETAIDFDMIRNMIARQ